MVFFTDYLCTMCAILRTKRLRFFRCISSSLSFVHNACWLDINIDPSCMHIFMYRYVRVASSNIFKINTFHICFSMPARWFFVQVSRVHIGNHDSFKCLINNQIIDAFRNLNNRIDWGYRSVPRFFNFQILFSAIRRTFAISIWSAHTYVRFKYIYIRSLHRMLLVWRWNSIKLHKINSFWQIADVGPRMNNLTWFMVNFTPLLSPTFLS